MNLNHLLQCYGRKEDIESLRRIFYLILKRSDGNSCEKCCPECASTVATENSSPTTSTSSTGDDGRSIPNISIVDDCLSYQGATVSNDCRLILISGPDGSGKRTLVYEGLDLFRSAKKCGHKTSLLQVSGQFRTYQRDEDQSNPYTNGRSREFENSLSAFHDAFREMVDVLLQDVDMIHAILDIFKGLLKDPKDAVVLTRTFPCLKKILLLDPMFQLDEVDPEVYSRVFLQGKPSTAERLLVLCRCVTLFIQAVSTCIPVVFVLEDLHFADTVSFALIESLLNLEAFNSESRSTHFLMVCTYSTDIDESLSDACQSFLPAENCVITDNGFPLNRFQASQQHNVHCIRLTNLSWDDVHEWTQNVDGVIGLLNVDQKRAVSDLVFHQTNGNPLHAQYLFRFLQNDETLLTDLIHKKSVPSTMAALYTSILLRQNDSVVRLVRCASSLARCNESEVVDCDILRVAMMKPCGDEVLQAQECGLIDFFPARGYVRFRRKEFQLAAYKTVPDSTSFTVSIGRCLWGEALLLHDKENATADDIKRMILRAILHLWNIMDVVSDFSERMQMSKFCYEYGLDLSQIGDFAASAKLFEFAIHVLGPDLWRSDLYETCLVLHNAAAQTYFYVCDVDKMERTLDAIFINSQSLKDKLPAYIILVYAKAKGQMKDGFRIICNVLSELGEQINSKPNALTVITSLFGMKFSLMGKSFELLSNLPDANEGNQIITHFLSFAMFFIYAVEPGTSFLLCSRLVQLSVKNGITGPAAVAFAQYGYILSGLGKLEEGYRFCRLSLVYANRFEVWRPRINMYVHGLTNFWTHPLRDSVDPLYQAQCDAVKYGDIQSYGVLAGFTISVLLKLGAPLKALQVDARSFCESLAKVGQVSPLFVLIPHWSVINDLTGSQERLNISGEIRDADTLLKFAAKEGAKVLLGRFYADRVMFHFLVGEYQQSLDMARKSYEHRKLLDFPVTFYEGLASSAVAWTSKPYQRQKCLFRCQKLAKLMRKWAVRCPNNFLNKQLLMDAEIAALFGKSSLALTLYEESVSKAKSENFLPEEGIAYERLGLYQQNIGNYSDAKVSFERARSAFFKWGASVVVDRIEKLITSVKVE